MYNISKARAPRYMAIVTRNWCLGYILRVNPARLAPIAGATREVNPRINFGYLALSWLAFSFKRRRRRRRKKRWSRRCRNNMDERDRASRKFGELNSGLFGRDLRDAPGFARSVEISSQALNPAAVPRKRRKEDRMVAAW